MKNVLFVFFLFSTLTSYAKIYINGIEVNKEDVFNLQDYLRYRAIADMVFEESKVASLKYYEKVLSKFPNDFVSLSRMALGYALKGVPELSLYYGTNAMNVYKKEDKRKVYTLNYLELLVALSVSYSLVRNEVNSYFYLSEAKNTLSKIYFFKSDYEKGVKLVNYANSVYRKEFYNITPMTNIYLK